MSVEPKLFKQVRLALAMTQAELAGALGISRVTVNKMERGRLRRGIPDEIGARLLNLRKAEPSPASVKGWEGWTTEQLAARSGVALDDTHLWDNEEDES